MNQPILLYRSGSVYANETAAWAALDAVTHKKGQPIVAFYTLSSPVSGHHGSSTIGVIFAIGIGDGVGQYKACTSHDDMLIVAQSLNAHITQFNQMFEYDANHNAIKAKLDFYTTDGKSISAGGIGSGSSASLGALYQLVDVMANSSNTGVEGAVEGSVLAYDATAGKWKAIAQSKILPDMSGYYTKDETDSAINTAKSNLQGQVDTLKALIPATATADNQLADKAFVNSSIATATAEFRGSFTSLDELKATSGNLNDYAFYLHNDSVGNSIVDRYKWTTAGWLYEYTLNNSSFTAEQWAAINSTITATLVQSYNSHLNNSTIHITAAERTSWNAKWDYNEETIKAVKVNAAVSADELTSNAGTSAIPIYFDGGIPVQCTPSALFYGFANGYDASAGGRILGITIAGHTRKVVVAYSTLAGSADKLATARKIWGRPFDGSGDVSGDLEYVGNITASGKATIQGDIISGGEVAAIVGEGTPAGVTDYSALTGKPAINGVTLVSGNNTLAALGIQAAGDYATNSGVTTLLADYAKKTFVANNYAGKSAFNSHTADTDIHITASERSAWNAKWDYDEATIKAVKVTSASSADSVAWTGISGKPTTFTPAAHTHTASDVSGLPTSLKNPYALTFGSKTYDGSAAATITASDLGALTAHQSIYAFTLQVNGTSKGTYNPASAAKTINIAVPTKTSDITNDSGFITSAAIPTALKNPYAVEIKANGVSLGTYDGSAAATFNLSAANVGAASKVHTHYSIVTEGDNRNIATTPNDYVKSFVFRGLKDNTIIGSPSSGIYSYVLGLRGWANNSGGDAHELAFNNSGIFRRQGSTTEWSSWYQLIDTGNFNSYSPTRTGTGASGTWGISISGNAATATNADTLDGKHNGEITAQYFSAGAMLTHNDTINRILSGVYSYINADNPAGSIGDNCILIAFRNRDRADNLQIVGTANDRTLYYRIAGNIGNQYENWTAWREFIHSDNYTQYAPSLTGSGAYGTWGISISGNAESATKLQTPRSIWGRPFDGSGDVSGEALIGSVLIGKAGNVIDGWSQGGGVDLYLNYNSTGNIRACYNGGNVIIGATSDSGNKLQVDGTASFVETINLYEKNEATRLTQYVYQNIGRIYAYNDTEGTYRDLWLGNNRGTALLIKSNTNILIGTTTDNGYKLDVNGKTHITGDLIVDGEVSALVA